MITKNYEIADILNSPTMYIEALEQFCQEKWDDVCDDDMFFDRDTLGDVYEMLKNRELFLSNGRYLWEYLSENKCEYDEQNACFIYKAEKKEGVKKSIAFFNYEVDNFDDTVKNNLWKAIDKEATKNGIKLKSDRIKKEFNKLKVKRDSVFRMGFVLDMNTNDVVEFLVEVNNDCDFDLRNITELIYYTAFANDMSFDIAKVANDVYTDIINNVNEEASKKKIENFAGTDIESAGVSDEEITDRIIRVVKESRPIVGKDELLKVKNLVRVIRNNKPTMSGISESVREEFNRLCTEAAKISKNIARVCSNLGFTDEYRSGENDEIMDDILKCALRAQRVHNIKNGTEVKRSDLLIIYFYVMCKQMEDEKDIFFRYREIRQSIDNLLEQYNMNRLSAEHRIDFIVLYSLLTLDPIESFRTLMVFCADEKLAQDVLTVDNLRIMN